MRKFPALLLLAALLAGATFFAGRQAHETPVPEQQAIGDINAGAVAALTGAYPAGEGPVRRAAHAKAHGCVKATFAVDPALPENLRVGTFALPGQRFKAWIRFSNSAFTPGPDRDPGGRGMAVKLIDANPDRADPNREDPVRTQPPHDLLLINYPVYFLANLQDFHSFMQAGAIKGDIDHLKPYFLPTDNPVTWRLRQLSILYRNATQKLSSPLHADYFSMTPYEFGPGRAIKYAAKPCKALAGSAPAEDDPDFLRQQLTMELHSGPACFELFAQFRAADLAIDDATEYWPEAISPLLRLGRIDIPAQDVAAAGRDALCENLSFNPANGPAALAPLGGVNQGRIELYRSSAAYRLDRNGAAPADAAQAWDRL